jgi:hypothetical protein
MPHLTLSPAASTASLVSKELQPKFPASKKASIFYNPPKLTRPSSRFQGHAISAGSASQGTEIISRHCLGENEGIRVDDLTHEMTTGRSYSSNFVDFRKIDSSPASYVDLLGASGILYANDEFGPAAASPLILRGSRLDIVFKASIDSGNHTEGKLCTHTTLRQSAHDFTAEAATTSDEYHMQQLAFIPPIWVSDTEIGELTSIAIDFSPDQISSSISTQVNVQGRRKSSASIFSFQVEGQTSSESVI